MKIVCPECGSAALWLLDDWVDAMITDEGIWLEGAGIACECRTCYSTFEVHAAGFSLQGGGD